MENIHYDFRVAIPQYDVSSNSDAFTIRWWRRQAPLQLDGNEDNVTLQVPRKSVADNELPFLLGPQTVSSGQARRQMSVIFAVPTSKFVAVMTGETVAAPIVIVVTVPVLIFVPPMSIVVIAFVVTFVILVVLVSICEGCVSGKHEKGENDGRKAFFRFQGFPPTLNGLGFKANAETRTTQCRRATLFPGWQDIFFTL